MKNPYEKCLLQMCTVYDINWICVSALDSPFCQYRSTSLHPAVGPYGSTSLANSVQYIIMYVQYMVEPDTDTDDTTPPCDYPIPNKGNS